jgi:hypothetical protein
LWKALKMMTGCFTAPNTTMHGKRRTLIFDNSRFGFQVGESHRLSSSFRRCNSHMGTSKNRIA